ncbi:MAG: hypothetical protein K2G21_01530 [Muribaculaceae bacterium]|nr:hypothetical protein [Muribaculaceae bacterium]
MQVFFPYSYIIGNAVAWPAAETKHTFFSAWCVNETEPSTVVKGNVPAISEIYY